MSSSIEMIQEVVNLLRKAGIGLKNQTEIGANAFVEEWVLLDKYGYESAATVSLVYPRAFIGNMKNESCSNEIEGICRVGGGGKKRYCVTFETPTWTTEQTGRFGIGKHDYKFLRAGEAATLKFWESVPEWKQNYGVGFSPEQVVKLLIAFLESENTSIHK